MSQNIPPAEEPAADAAPATGNVAQENVNQGTQAVNQGTQVVNQGTQEVNQGTQAVNQGTGQFSGSQMQALGTRSAQSGTLQSGSLQTGIAPINEVQEYPVSVKLCFQTATIEETKTYGPYLGVFTKTDATFYGKPVYFKMTGGFFVYLFYQEVYATPDWRVSESLPIAEGRRAPGWIQGAIPETPDLLGQKPLGCPCDVMQWTVWNYEELNWQDSLIICHDAPEDSFDDQCHRQITIEELQEGVHAAVDLNMALQELENYRQVAENLNVVHQQAVDDIKAHRKGVNSAERRFNAARASIERELELRQLAYNNLKAPYQDPQYGTLSLPTELNVVAAELDQHKRRMNKELRKMAMNLDEVRAAKINSTQSINLKEKDTRPSQE